MSFPVQVRVQLGKVIQRIGIKVEAHFAGACLQSKLYRARTIGLDNLDVFPLSK